MLFYHEVLKVWNCIILLYPWFMTSTAVKLTSRLQNISLQPFLWPSSRCPPVSCSDLWRTERESDSREVSVEIRITCISTTVRERRSINVVSLFLLNAGLLQHDSRLQRPSQTRRSHITLSSEPDHVVCLDMTQWLLTFIKFVGILVFDKW